MWQYWPAPHSYNSIKRRTWQPPLTSCHPGAAAAAARDLRHKTLQSATSGGQASPLQLPTRGRGGHTSFCLFLTHFCLDFQFLSVFFTETCFIWLKEKRPWWCQARTSQLPIHLHASNNSFLSSLSCRFENCPTPVWHSFGHYFNKSLISSVGALTVPSTRQTQFVYCSDFLFKKLFVLFSRGINLEHVFVTKNLQIFIPLLTAGVHIRKRYFETWTRIYL